MGTIPLKFQYKIKLNKENQKQKSSLLIILIDIVIVSAYFIPKFKRIFAPIDSIWTNLLKLRLHCL